jgi:hypothetical protein
MLLSCGLLLNDRGPLPYGYVFVCHTTTLPVRHMNDRVAMTEMENFSFNHIAIALSRK